MHWSVNAGVSKSLSSRKPPRHGWPSLKPPSSCPLFPALLQFFVTLTSPLSLLAYFCHPLIWSPSDSPFYFLLLSLNFVPKPFLPHLHLRFFLSSLFLPPQPKWPPVLWDLISVKSKVQSLLGPEIQKQRQRDREREREIESVAPQTHKTTVASPQAQRLGPGRLAGPLSTSLGAKLNTNRRGLAVETKPWCHAAYFPWKALGVLGPTPGDMRSP